MTIITRTLLIFICLLTSSCLTKNMFGVNSKGEADMVDKINEFRVNHHLLKLRVDDKLTAAAKIQSSNIARMHTLTHTLDIPNIRTLSDRLAYVGFTDTSYYGENILYIGHSGEGLPNSDSILSMWATSKGHRANILNDRFKRTGFAITKGDDDMFYYCQVFSD